MAHIGGQDASESEFVVPGKRSRPAIEEIEEGMRVVDAAGDELGKVELVRMGDPEATTVSPAIDERQGLYDKIVEAAGFGDEPQLAESLRGHLLRIGFIKIDGPGLTDTDRYAAADQIAGVTGDTVRLRVQRSELAQEMW